MRIDSTGIRTWPGNSTIPILSSSRKQCGCRSSKTACLEMKTLALRITRPLFARLILQQNWQVLRFRLGLFPEDNIGSLSKKGKGRFTGSSHGSNVRLKRKLKWLLLGDEKIKCSIEMITFGRHSTQYYLMKSVGQMLQRRLKKRLFYSILLPRPRFLIFVVAREGTL